MASASYSGAITTSQNNLFISVAVAINFVFEIKHQKLMLDHKLSRK
jgi:hypothetical protein